MRSVVHQPKTTSEVLELLREYGPDAKVLAGGTALMIMLRARLVEPAHVVSLDRVRELRWIRRDGAVLRLGATATLREVGASQPVRDGIPILADVVRLVANHRIRAAATIGGNLAEADYASDPPPILVGLDARVRLQSARGERWVPVAELLTYYYETCIEPDELLTEIELPIPAPDLHAVYIKFTSRSVDDRPCVGAAAFVATGADGRVRRLRAVVGAVGPTPFQAHGLEESFVGRELDREVADTVAAACSLGVEPISDLRGSGDYRRRVIRALVARAVRAAGAGRTEAVRA